MSTRIHAAKFERHAHRENLEGPEIYEVYKPLCGTDPLDARVTHKEDRVTCHNCRRMLGLACPHCGVTP